MPNPFTSSSMKIGDLRPPVVANFTKRSVNLMRFSSAASAAIQTEPSLQSARFMCGQQGAPGGISPGKA